MGAMVRLCLLFCVLCCEYYARAVFVSWCARVSCSLVFASVLACCMSRRISAIERADTSAMAQQQMPTDAACKLLCRERGEERHHHARRQGRRAPVVDLHAFFFRESRD